MKPKDVRIEDTATLLVAKRKINEVIADISRIRTEWQGEGDSVQTMLKEAEGLLGDARGNIMGAASLILNEEVDKATKEDRP